MIVGSRGFPRPFRFGDPTVALFLHDPAVRDSIRARVQKLSPASTRAWGTMSVDQMLWHVNEVLEATLGRRDLAPMNIPLPNPVLKFFVTNVPWMKGAPTHPSWVAGARYSFDVERERTLALIDEFSRRRLDEPWPPSAAFGPASGRDWSRLQAKHLDHHLRQFSA